MKIKTKKQLEFCLQADYMINRGKFRPSLYDRLRNIILPDYIMSYLSSMRRVSYYNSGGGIFNKLKFLYYFRKYYNLGVKLGFSIGYDVFEYGLLIPHYGTIVINGEARVGKYAVLHTCTNIAGKKVIGDGLYLSTGSQIVGDINIGDNVSIASNSLVNKSIQDNVLVGGVPAVVLKQNYPIWYIRDGQKFLDRVNKIEILRKEMNIDQL